MRPLRLAAASQPTFLLRKNCTPSLAPVYYYHNFASQNYGGDEENRTPDPLLARQVLSQLSYTPILCAFQIKFCEAKFNLVGLSGLEPPTSRLSGVRSNRLSYRPTPDFFEAFQPWAWGFEFLSYPISLFGLQCTFYIVH